MGEQELDQRAYPKEQRDDLNPGESETNAKETASSPEGVAPLPEAELQVNPLPCPADIESMTCVDISEKQDLTQKLQTESRLPDSINPSGASVVSSQHKMSQETSKRCKPSNEGKDPDPQRAKRTCLGGPPASVAHALAAQTDSIEGSSQTSKYDPLPLPPLPPVKPKAKAESKAFPVSECNKTTLEVELLTPGKRAQRLPLTSNNTAQTNQNRLAASLRGLSVKPASSGSSISSRSTLGEEGSVNVPRTSRLRRLKRS